MSYVWGLTVLSETAWYRKKWTKFLTSDFCLHSDCFTWNYRHTCSARRIQIYKAPMEYQKNKTLSEKFQLKFLQVIVVRMWIWETYLITTVYCKVWMDSGRCFMLSEMGIISHLFQCICCLETRSHKG